MVIEIRVASVTRRPIGLGNEDKGFEGKCHIPAIVAVVWGHGSRDVLRMGLRSNALLASNPLAAIVCSVENRENGKINHGDKKQISKA